MGYYDSERNDSAETTNVEVPEDSSATNEVSAFEDDAPEAAGIEETPEPETVAPETAEAPEADKPESVENKDSEEEEKEKSGLEPQSYVNIEGNRFRTDDNGDIHMYYEKESKTWKMMPNTEYVSNGYKYETDANGDIVHAEGKLRLSDERKALNDKVEGVTEDDDRGHIFADRFDGSNHRDNLFPQLTEDNRGKYRDLESDLAKEVAAKKDVQMSVDLVYPEDDEDSHRPDYVYVTYSIDGEETVRKFDNRRDS